MLFKAKYPLLSVEPEPLLSPVDSSFILQPSEPVVSPCARFDMSLSYSNLIYLLLIFTTPLPQFP